MQSNISYESESLLTEVQAARLLNFSVKALQAWRCRGGGPVFIKLSARAVRYRRSDLAAWVESHLRRSTTETEN